jgi:hypothetical protein
MEKGQSILRVKTMDGSLDSCIHDITEWKSVPLGAPRLSNETDPLSVEEEEIDNNQSKEETAQRQTSNNDKYTIPRHEMSEINDLGEEDSLDSGLSDQDSQAAPSSKEDHSQSMKEKEALPGMEQGLKPSKTCEDEKPSNVDNSQEIELSVGVDQELKPLLVMASDDEITKSPQQKVRNAEDEILTVPQHQERSNSTANSNMQTPQPPHNVSIDGSSHRNFRFGKVIVREYVQTVGDNPSCLTGVPVSLGWTYDCNHDEYPLDVFEKNRAIHRRHICSMKMPPKIREQILRNEWGASTKEIIQASKASKLVQKQRRETLKDMMKRDKRKKIWKAICCQYE